MNQSLTTTANNAKTSVTTALSKNGLLSIAGISLPEIAVLGAAGYVLWKNREQIENILVKGGVQVPSIMKADMNELIATGAAFLAKSKRSMAEEGSSRDEQGSSSNMGSRDASKTTGQESTQNASSKQPAGNTNPGQFANKDAGAKKAAPTAHDA